MMAMNPKPPVRRDEGSTSTVVYYDEYDVLHVQAQQKYKTWGETRQVTGELPTDRTFQGQRGVGVNALWCQVVRRLS